jgi:glycosyltransferase involved in cell wall biosynthesis
MDAEPFQLPKRLGGRRAGGFYGPALKALSWRVDEIWGDCEAVLHETRPYFLPRRRRHQVVPLFVADDTTAQKQSYALHAPLRLAAAGRLIDRKNFDSAIDAVRLLDDRGIAATLDLYGDGPERSALEAKARALRLHDRVRLHGYVANWSECAVDSDIFLNLSDTEGFCIVVAEAMLAGLPVIATAVGGIREYGRDGVNMREVAHPSAELAAAQVARLAKDESLRRKLGIAARERMLREYSVEALRERAAVVLAAGNTSRRRRLSRAKGVVR